MFKTYVHLTKIDIINEAKKRNGIEALEEEAHTDALKNFMRSPVTHLNHENLCAFCPQKEQVSDLDYRFM